MSVTIGQFVKLLCQFRLKTSILTVFEVQWTDSMSISLIYTWTNVCLCITMVWSNYPDIPVLIVRSFVKLLYETHQKRTIQYRCSSWSVSIIAIYSTYIIIYVCVYFIMLLRIGIDASVHNIHEFHDAGSILRIVMQCQPFVWSLVYRTTCIYICNISSRIYWLAHPRTCSCILMLYCLFIIDFMNLVGHLKFAHW